MEQTIEERVSDILAQELGVEVSDIKPDSRLVEDFCLDSLDSIQLAVELEEEFHINIPAEVERELRTVQQIYDYVVKAVTV